MASTTFVDKQTVIAAAWLNDVNYLTYSIFNGLSAVPSAGKIFRSNGTNVVASTSTFADTYSINTLLYASAANAVTGLATVNSALLTTSAGGVPTWSNASASFPYTLGIGQGGTGQTSANAAFNALAPTTTKGDLIGFSTINARLPVGTNGQYLVADSTQSLGVKWGQTTQQTRTVLTSGSSATYTTPAGCTRILVRMVGGGGGGSAAITNAGTAGNNTTFGTLTAGGGGAGQLASSQAVGTGGTASGGDINIPGMQGGGGIQNGLAFNPPGASGGNSVFGGAGSGAPNANGGNAATNSGSGGGGGGGASSSSGGGGGAGGYVEKLIVAPNATYTYTVGAAASGGVAGGTAGGAGAAGIIIVDEFYN